MVWKCYGWLFARVYLSSRCMRRTMWIISLCCEITTLLWWKMAGWQLNYSSNPLQFFFSDGRNSEELWLDPDFAGRSNWLIGSSSNPRLWFVDNLHRLLTVPAVCLDLDVTWSTEVLHNLDAIYWFLNRAVTPSSSFLWPTLFFGSYHNIESTFFSN